MSSIAKERPGIYSDYNTSGIFYTKNIGKSIAIVAQLNVEVSTVYTVTKLSDAQVLFGIEGIIISLCKAAFDNGAYSIVIISAGSQEEGYELAFRKLKEIDNISVVICDSTDSAVQQLLAESVIDASQNKKERIGILAAPEGKTNLNLWASGFNSERIILTAQNPVDKDDDILSGCILTAAMAAVISQNIDPSQSFNGVSLEGITKLSQNLTEDNVDDYITKGITPFEIIAGKAEIIRAVTSRKTTNENADKTFKEVNTILIIDKVIKSIRTMLESNIMHSMNNVTTRGAISSQVTIKLQEFLDTGIIDSYAVPNVYQADYDDSVCIVELDFTVTQGVNQIHITVNINI